MSANATTTTINLTGDYRRVFVLHILSHIGANTADESGWEQQELEPVSIDHMITRGIPAALRPWVGHWERSRAALLGLAEVTDMNITTFQWPFEHEALVEGMEDCIMCLRESLKDLPAEQLEALARAVGPAEAFLASLRYDDQEGGDA